jgi:hypothetical protein
MTADVELLPPLWLSCCFHMLPVHPGDGMWCVQLLLQELSPPPLLACPCGTLSALPQQPVNKDRYQVHIVYIICSSC